MSTPITGMLAGLIVGVMVGVLMTLYFEVPNWLGRFCVVGANLLVFQLLGATIGAAIGKPHEPD